MKMEKIYEFDPIIYPFRLWICIKPDSKSMAEKFYALNYDMERVEIIEEKEKSTTFTVARTTLVSDICSGWIGPLVAIYKPSKMSTAIIAHEASHVADFACNHLGIQATTFDDGEAKAYIVQWAADCIYKVKSGKIR